MKTTSKVLLLVLCAVLLVTATAMGTTAFLTSRDSVENTFTVGSIKITMDELDIAKNDGSRTNTNAYTLVPGFEYTKDPTVHVDTVSENSWIFVKVENGIAAYEAPASEGDGAYKPIAEQITANGWTALDGVDGVYYKAYTKNDSGADLVVFENFRIADDANDKAGWSAISPETTKVNVTAYAVQKDGFDTALAAWNATFGK